MKFFNLMNVADTRISMMLTGIDPTNKKIGFDFTTNKWLDNNLYTPNRIITVRKFRGTWIYKKLASNALVNFSTLKIKNIKALKDIETFRGTILIVEVHLSYQKFPFLKQNTKKLTKEAHEIAKADTAKDDGSIIHVENKIEYVPYTGNKSFVDKTLNYLIDKFYKHYKAKEKNTDETL